VLKTAGGAAVTAAVTYNATTHVATLNPTATLAANTKYTATLVGGPLTGPTPNIRDVAGNALANKSWSFTTGAV
jgi:hypothetical protein